MRATPSFCRILLPALLAALAPTAASAQWSPDPAENVAISSRPDEQVQPKVAPIATGGWYVSWFDNDPSGSPPGGYDVYLQRFDAAGVPQWPGGLLVADRGLSWTTDYDLVVDRDGHAILAFNQDGPGGESPLLVVTKIDRTGRFLWGRDGVLVGRDGTDKLAPSLALTSDGRIAVLFQDGEDVGFTSLTPDGTAAWERLIPAPRYRTYAAGDIAASDEGSVIVSYTFNGVDTGSGSVIHLLANKFSSTGAPRWGEKGLVVYDTGFLKPAQNHQVLSDGKGGAVFVFRTRYPLADVYVQHVNGGGLRTWNPKGVAVATEPTWNRSEQSATFDPATGHTTVFYVDERGGFKALAAQRFDGSGRRLWTDGGRLLRPFARQHFAHLVSARHGDQQLVYWIEETAVRPATLLGARVSPAGAFLCGPFDVSTTSPHRNVDVGVDANGTSLLAWTDTRSDWGDVYAQNVNADCTLGPAAE